MPSPPKPRTTLAALQLQSTNQLDENLARCEALLTEARVRGATIAVLPENFAFMGGSESDKRGLAESLEGDGPILGMLRRAARAHGLWIVAGGFPERSEDGDRPFNTCAVLDPSGDVRAAYRKIHLFDVEVGDGQVYRESSSTSAGSEAVLVEIAGLQVGLSVCYDLRFPELYRALVARGAELLVVPAAFTLMTGKDHWLPLLRARAIENQCWVVAAAQWGEHPGGRRTYGKSCLVDPWGDVVAQASEGVGLVVSDVDPALTARVREKLPALRHRRLG